MRLVDGKTNDLSPRLHERGLVEASKPKFGDPQSGNSPRLHERGLVEATWSVREGTTGLELSALT